MNNLTSENFSAALKMVCKEYGIQINKYQLDFFLKHVVSGSDITEYDKYLEESKYFENYK